MPTLEDVPLLAKMCAQLERVAVTQDKHTAFVESYLARAEQREEKLETRGQRVEETLDAIEDGFKEIGKQLGRLSRIASETAESGRRAAELHESRLRRLEAKTMVRRDPPRGEYDEEVEDTPAERPARRGERTERRKTFRDD